MGRPRGWREKDAVWGPVGEEQTRDPTVRGGQGGDDGSIQSVPDIEVRRAARPRVEQQRISAKWNWARHIIRQVVNRVRPSVRHKHMQSPAKAPVELNLHCVVARTGSLAHN